MNRDIGFGMVGFGMIGRTHLAAILANKALHEGSVNAYPRGLCTRRPELCGDLPFEKIYANPEELTADPLIKVVDICTPNNLHAPAATAAIKAGKCVYVEKPLSNDLEEAEELNRLVQKTGIPNQCALTIRFRPHVNRMKDLLLDGAIGDVIHFRTCFFHGSYLDPNRLMSWRQDLAVSGGGAVMDLGIHILDLIGYFLGDVYRLRAVSRIVHKVRYQDNEQKFPCVNETDEYLGAFLEMKNGGTGVMETSRISSSALCNEVFEVFGTKGSLALDFEGPGSLRLNPAKGTGTVLVGEQTGSFEKALAPLLPPARQSLGPFMDAHAAAVKNIANWSAGEKPFTGT
ncbi:MAG: Gfo/Idh/MocA family oxidoreductase, partial [Treponema sp.]|nr:Gfo/Idh/MocA family oxidoreductase [Treponema sp.]